MKMKKLLATAVLGVFAAALTGCGAVQKGEVTLTSGTAANYSISTGYDDEFFEVCAELAGENSETLKEAFKQETIAQGGTISEEEIEGVTYTMATLAKNGVSLSAVEEQLAAGLLITDVCLTKDYFYGVFDPTSDEYTDSMSQAGANLSSTGDTDEDINFYQTFSLTFTSPVTGTNGTIDPANPNRVTWVNRDMNKKKTFWATTSTAAGTAKTTSVKNNKIYKKQKTIKVNNAGNLARMTLGKKDSIDGAVVSTKTLKTGAVVKANGFYELTIWSKDGKCQKVNFVIDKKKPTISGAKNGKTYKKSVTLKFKDAHSGIKSVTVNGKKISAKKYSGYTIKKNGKYKIVVTDKAGNKKTITIRIKK